MPQLTGSYNTLSNCTFGTQKCADWVCASQDAPIIQTMEGPTCEVDFYAAGFVFADNTTACYNSSIGCEIPHYSGVDDIRSRRPMKAIMAILLLALLAVTQSVVAITISLPRVAAVEHLRVGTAWITSLPVTVSYNNVSTAGGKPNVGYSPHLGSLTNHTFLIPGQSTIEEFSGILTSLGDEPVESPSLSARDCPPLYHYTTQVTATSTWLGPLQIIAEPFGECGQGKLLDDHADI